MGDSQDTLPGESSLKTANPQDTPELSEPKESAEASPEDSKEESGDKEERKTTQTDHINKKLLGAFLERLNQKDNSVSFGLNAQNNDDDNDFVDQTDSLNIVDKQ